MRSVNRLVVCVAICAGVVACGDDDGDDGESAVSTTLSSEPAVAFCQLMEQSDDVEPSGGETPPELEAKLAEFEALLGRIVEAAPTEIAAEVEQSRDAYSQLIDVAAAAGYALETADPDRIAELSDVIEDNADVIQAWLDTNCPE